MIQNVFESIIIFFLLLSSPCIIDLNKSSSKAGRINHFYNDKWFLKIISCAPQIYDLIVFLLFFRWYHHDFASVKMYANIGKITYNKIFVLNIFLLHHLTEDFLEFVSPSSSGIYFTRSISCLLLFWRKRKEFPEIRY